jgi:hypothetical protein
MIFKPKNQSEQENSSDNNYQLATIEKTLKSVAESKAITLAVCQVFEEGVGFGLDEQGEKFSEAKTCRITGVKNELSKKPSYISFDISLDPNLDCDGLGKISFSKLEDGFIEGESLGELLGRIIDGNIAISGLIKDEDYKISRSIETAAKNACISDDKFFHVMLILEEFDNEQQLENIKNRNYSDSIKVVGVRFFNTITLPKAVYLSE